MRLFCPTIVAAILAVIPTVGMAQERAASESPATAKDEVAAKPSPCQTAIDKAAADNKYVFVLFWKEQSPQLDKAWGELKPVVTSMADKAVFLSIQITNPAEKKIVDKYGVTRAPMPLVLALAPSGAVTKAFTKTFDEKELRTAYVSPCKEQCLKALQDRKLVFVCVVEKTDPKAPLAVPKGVEDFKADKRFASATAIVVVDAQDENEVTLLKELEIGKAASKPITVFLGPPGALIGKFGDVSKDVLVAKLAAAMSNRCGGGKCGPGGCPPPK